MTIAALYIDPRGPYPRMADLDVDAWDEARDARRYEGPWPVVAHPPCGPWGRLRHRSSKQDPDLGPRAFEQVRRWGGVLEHPAWSTLFDHVRAPRGALGRVSFPDSFGGRTIEVNQCDFGHVARKRTWLYFVGCQPILPLPDRKEPTHWISGGRAPRRDGSSRGGVRPVEIKAFSAQQRRRTPDRFAAYLVACAMGAVCQWCGGAVEEPRRCFAVPTCYGCLPPPPPIPILTLKLKGAENA